MRSRGLTLLEVVVVVILLAVVAAMVLMWPERGGTIKETYNTTQKRGIHQGMVIYAMANNHYFPGLDGDGKLVPGGGDPAGRFKILMEGDYFTPEYAISPVENGKVPWSGIGSVTTANFSYALRVLTPQGWRADEDPTKAIVSDRPIINGTNRLPTPIRSIHTSPRTNKTIWHGSVVYNDGREEFLKADPGLFDAANDFANPTMVYSDSVTAW